eukprot:c13939_g1_i1.p1 GENE.c13939_g1_i1~~c13939_g1_i1.p1  ORF type:complete len:327 (-),score=72.60 c13939_g1_i1:49-1029(-)
MMEPPPPKVIDARDAAAMNCRFYEKKYPDVDDIVTVQVNSIAEMGAYCSLLEYNNIEGMILFSELSRRRIRSVNKLIRVGRNEVVMVLRVDQEKGYIDLSKRRVSPEDVGPAEDRFNKAKQVHSIVRHTAEVLHKTTQELCEMVSWPLYKTRGDAYEAFSQAVLDPDEVLKDLNLPKEVQAELVHNIRRRLAPMPIRLRAEVAVTCFTYEGIEAIKAALSKGLIGEGDETVKIALLAPPVYVLTCTCLNTAQGVSQLNKSIELIKTAIEASGGKMEIKQEPRAVSDHQIRAYEQAMATLAANKNAEDDSNSEGSIEFDPETELANK